MIRVLIVDDDSSYLQALSAYLSSHPDLDVVGSAPGGEQAIRMAASLDPDVVVMDLAMPRTDGLTATRAIVSQNPDTSVLVLTAHESPEARRRSLAAGAVAFESKRSSPSTLVERIREAWTSEPGEDDPQP